MNKLNNISKEYRILVKKEGNEEQETVITNRSTGNQVCHKEEVHKFSRKFTRTDLIRDTFS